MIAGRNRCDDPTESDKYISASEFPKAGYISFLRYKSKPCVTRRDTRDLPVKPNLGSDNAAGLYVRADALPNLDFAAGDLDVLGQARNA